MNMCRTFEEIRDDAANYAYINSIRNLMETFKLTAQLAMDALKIPAEKQAEYAEKLSS